MTLAPSRGRLNIKYKRQCKSLDARQCERQLIYTLII